MEKRNDCNLKLSKKMALTCCVLHNICEEDEEVLLRRTQTGTQTFSFLSRYYQNMVIQKGLTLELH